MSIKHLTTDEKQFIKDNCQQLSLKEIADKLYRDEKIVATYYKKLPVAFRTKRNEPVTHELDTSHYWERVKKLLFKDEVQPFKQQWENYIHQFGGVGDIVATDENMILDLILFDVFANRTLLSKKEALEQIEDIKRQLKIEQQKDLDSRDRDLCARLNEQLNSYRSALTELTKEHLQYQERKDSKLKDLKATREQRFKQIQESKRDFFELLKELDNEKTRQREGKFAEKLRLATEKLTAELQASHKYEDGTYDSPFLIAEE
jgi:hypothetical protein